MNILYISIFYGLLKPKTGGQNRFFHIADQIRDKGHKLIVLEPEIFMDPTDKEFGSIYTYKEFKLFSRTISLSKDFNLNFIKKMINILKSENIDIILTTHPSGAFVLKILTKLMRKKITLIYDAHNVESEFTKQIFTNNKEYSKLDQILIPFYVNILEIIACKHLVDHIICVSKDDKNAFIRNYGINAKKVSVLPSGCHIKAMIPEKKKKNMRMKLGINPSCKIVIFHGSYSHPPNKEAFHLIKEYIAPQFESKNDVIFLLGGSKAPIFENKNVKSIGFINDLWEFVSMADIAIVPLKKGGGTKLKLLDYLNAGLPIITTKKGIEGIEAINGKDLIVTDSVDKEFVNNIEYLLENEKERKKLARNARKLAEEKYDWNSIGINLNALIRRY